MKTLFALLTASFLAKAENIGTAFGVTIGQPIPESVSLLSSSTNGPLVISRFRPSGVRYIDSVYVTSYVTKDTNAVVCVTGFASFENRHDSEEAFEVVKEVLIKKYVTDKSRTRNGFNEFVIDQGDRSVRLKSQIELSRFPRSYGIHVSYGDEKLAQVASDAQKAKLVKETPSTNF